MMGQNARNHARMCLFGVKIFNVVLAILAGKRLLKLLKLNNSFIVSFFVTVDNSRPKYKNLIGFWGEYKILGEYSPYGFLE